MADKVSFGLYELDRDARELRKRGVLIRLQDQPLRVLAILTKRPGEVVTREELQEQIWGKETFVDFEQSLNKAVNRAREALNDEADLPRYIETVPRRGYRFIAPVEVHGKQDAPQPVSADTSGAAVQSAVTVEFQPLPSPINAADTILNASGLRRRVALASVASILVATLFLAFWRLAPTAQPRITNSLQLTNDGLSKWCVATDGSRIYFTEQHPERAYGGIQQVPVTGGDPTAVLAPSLKGSLTVMDISHDRDRLLVEADISNMEGSLWSLPVSGSSPRPLNDVPVGPYFAGAKWSPDGLKLVYANGSDLRVAESDGSEPRTLITAKGEVSSPVWSPDGKSLRFLVTESATSAAGTWLEVSAEGGKPRKVTPRWQSNCSPHDGTWTPDGRFFVFLADCGPRTDIWAIREKRSFLDLTKREPIRLTAGPLSYGSFTISPDGKKIFALGIELRGEAQRYDRGSRQFVPMSPALSADCCTYSNDGQWMAYVTLFPSRVFGEVKRTGRNDGNSPGRP